MPTSITPPTTPPVVSIDVGSKEDLQRGRDQIAILPEQAGLLQPGPEDSRSAGVVGTRAQTRQSFAILRFHQENPDLAPLFKEVQPERHRYFTGLRLYAGQARAVAEQVQEALEGADLWLRAQVTEDNDRIEDHFTQKWSDPQTPAAERVTLEGRFRDPLRLRQMAAESLEQRRARRQGRRLLRRGARAEAERLVTDQRDTAQLRRAGTDKDRGGR